jgi:hypothetical protein
MSDGTAARAALADALRDEADCNVANEIEMALV